MTAWTCRECGGQYPDPRDNCHARFDALLALDHSRQEPWGSRHGLAFAAFALQHPETHARSVEHAWLTLCRIYLSHVPAAQVFATLVAHGGRWPADWDAPSRPERPVALPSITIRDLGDFSADTYAAQLDAWCRASLAAWIGP